MPVSSDSICLYDVEDGVATIRFNRPDKLNALNRELSQAIASHTRRAQEDDDVRVLVYTGEGDAFAAGADINRLQELETAYETYQFVQQRKEFWDTIADASKPTVARINGYALGAGLELCLACDLRIASMEASFGLPEVKLGILPGGGGTQRLPRLVGEGIAKELLMTGKTIDAKRAEKIGLVNRAVESDELDQAVDELTSTLTKRPPLAVQMIKHTVEEGLQVDLERGLTIERESFALLFSTEDRDEGVEAFLEKREPDFKGK